VATRAPRQAIVLAELANTLTEHRVPELLDTLAAAYAADGQFERAAGLLERALELAESGTAAAYRVQFRKRLALYRDGRPYLDTAGTP